MSKPSNAALTRFRCAAHRASAIRIVASTIAWAAVAGSAGAQSGANAPTPDGTTARLHEAARQLGAHSGERRSAEMSSRDEGGQVRAEIQGLIDRPFGDLRRALADPAQWCAVLLLHINNKKCTTATSGALPAQTQFITLKVARKFDQPVEQAFELKFSYRVLAASPTLLSVQLDAAQGPFGTHDYLIRLDAGPAPDNRTVLNLSNAYRQGTMTGLAMDLYFATVGRGKVGFTETGRGTDGRATYVGGARGLIERNLMRYFLAIEAAAAEPDIDAAGAYDRRLSRWFNGAEAHARQLHEVELATYLDLKRTLWPLGK